MKPVSFGRRPGTLMCALLLGVMSSASGKADEYLLQPGDVLSVMIVGATGLEQAVPVEMDGTAWFPIIGEVQAAGATLRQIRERVADAYSVTRFPKASAAERAPQFVQSNQVNVSVEEYRPIYVSGDLLSLSIDFRPGLTLRQAVILAGGGDGIKRDAIVVRERVEAVMLALAQAYGRIWSLKTLLGTNTPQDHANIFVVDTETVREIAELERSLVSARTEDLERQERTIATNIKRAEMRLVALRKLRASEEEGRLLDAQIVANLRELTSKGLASASRLADVRRAALSSASRVLELDATIEEVRTELAELEAEAESVKVGAQSEAWSELSEAITRVFELRAELATLRAEGAAVGLVRDDVVASITRRGEVLPPIDTGSADQDLQPGDIIEILLTSSNEAQN